jgi:HD-GYP domain-containing protein (c-di-GMP phosphodiesterase class II)
MSRPHEHAYAGYRLLRNFPHLSGAAAMVRYHHVPWDHGRGERWLGAPVPLGSHIIHLADRVSVLIRSRADIVDLGREVRRTVAAAAGSLFMPELVEAFQEAARAESFWLQALAPSAVCGEPGAPECAAVADADAKELARFIRHLVDFRSRFTATHTSGVAAVARHLGGLCGIEGPECGRLTLAASLHDLGKLAVPTEILEKEQPLTPEDIAVLRSHPYHGHRILAGVPGLEQINFHHERVDGSGYPFRLSAAGLSLGSRIIAVADVFAALTEERPYRRGLSGREAFVILGAMAGDGTLDPGVVDAALGRGEEVVAVHRLARESAAARYLGFLETAAEPSPACVHAA